MTKVMKKFSDGLRSLSNNLINKRQAVSNNRFQDTRLPDETLRAMYLSGVASKIYRMKSSYALNNTLQFDNDSDEDIYIKRLKKAVKKASLFQLAFGRGLVVINEIGKDLSLPLGKDLNLDNVKLDVFSGDMVSSVDVSLDLANRRYYEPKIYIIKGYQFHWSRVVDFRYLEPAEYDRAEYRYGGVPLAQLIYEQLLNDAIIQRALPTIVEKSSSFFYKIKGFKNRLQNRREAEIVQYVSTSEDSRSIYGAGILDAEDDVSVVNQQLNGLKEIDDTSLRRLALVTGIPVSILVGESVRGLNSSGEEERNTFNDANSEYQDDYLIDPINCLASAFGLGGITFRESAVLNPSQQVDYDSRAIDNAVKMVSIGEDGIKYLEEKGVINADMFDKIFEESSDADNVSVPEDEDPDLELNEESGKEIVSDPSRSLNGAQVTSMIDVVMQYTAGDLKREAAREILITAFPIDEATVTKLLGSPEDVTIEPVVEGNSQSSNKF